MKTLSSYIAQVEKKNGTYDEVRENASAGSTSAANVAVCIGGLNGQSGGIGLGFDPDGDWGVYDSAKPKKKPAPKAVVLKR